MMCSEKEEDFLQDITSNAGKEGEMDVLEEVRKAIAEKVESDEATSLAAKLNELWRMLKEAAEIGMHVIVHVHTSQNHWRIFLNGAGDLVVDGNQNSWILEKDDAPDDPDDHESPIPTYRIAWFAVFSSFAKDVSSSPYVVRVEIETYLERLERERMS
jgi:hypothetical protein